MLHPMRREGGVSLKLHASFARIIPPELYEISEYVYLKVKYAESRNRILFGDALHWAVLSNISERYDDTS